jgi:hypothetical protein
MISYREVINGIRCKQFGKMFQDDYSHPLKLCIVKENKSFASWACLQPAADEVSKTAHKLIIDNIHQSWKKLPNDQLLTESVMLQQLGETETVHMTKENKRTSPELTRLVFKWNCNNLRDIIRQGRQYRQVVKVCKKIFMAKFVRLAKLLIQSGTDPPREHANKIRLANGTYKHISLMSSKDFRLLLSGNDKINPSKYDEGLDELTVKEYLNHIKRLKNTRHKNTLLRIWNGDCLSNSRLFHFGLAATVGCPRCGEYDSPEHMLVNCVIIVSKVPK